MHPAYAHTLPGRPPSEWQPLDEHLQQTARRAAEHAAAFGADRWAELAGLWHDLGKYSDEFQQYLHSSAAADGVHAAEMRGRVDHSTAGAQHAVNLGPAGYLLAYIIAGHHGGLPDALSEGPCLEARLEKQISSTHAAPRSLLERGCPEKLPIKSRKGRLLGFSLAFFTRMVFSCLVDADFLDTESFLNPQRGQLRDERQPSCAELLTRLDEYLARKQEHALDTEVNRRRREVLEACRARAELRTGLFSLHVPTGGGKTLSSLDFALRHAQHHGLNRVVYAIPFTSIIEQTAQVFREALGDLGDAVLEHHSNLDRDDPDRQNERLRLASENFDAPLVVTTNVQLFESLFANRPSRCRKLHRLARSVIVLDEVQTLPVGLLEPTLAALRELTTNYGATVVLCSATQPAIEYRDGFEIGLKDVQPIIEDPTRLHRVLRRTEVEQLGRLENEELIERLLTEPQALCIVNSRPHAAALFQSLNDPDALHLSASMCPEHRATVVAEIRRRLEPGEGRPCRVISTQVIEAGVDIDFPVVFRAVAGLDSIAQAAGRCNREGGLVDSNGQPRPGRVYVFDYDTKTYPTVTLIRDGARHFREVAPDYTNDLLSPEAVEQYFRLHYWQSGGDDGRGWDQGYERQSVCDCFHSDPKKLVLASFQKAADAYRLIDDAQVPVLVPYGKGVRLIQELEAMPESPDPAVLRRFDRESQRFCVGVYDSKGSRGLAALEDKGVLLSLHGRYYLANREAYDVQAGLRFDKIGLDADRMVF